VRFDALFLLAKSRISGSTDYRESNIALLPAIARIRGLTIISDYPGLRRASHQLQVDLVRL
jgi:hypothetical protein